MTWQEILDMAQITTGIRGILSLPFFYNLLQNGLGAAKARKTLVTEYLPKRQELSLLDIGCGTGEILDYLPSDTRYTGFDASEAYIAQATRRYGQRGSFVTGLVGSTELDKLDKFDVVLAYGVLHHLDEHDANKLFETAASALKPDGIVITVDPCFTPHQSRVAHWLISHDRGQNVRSENGYRQLGLTYFNDVSSFPRHDMLYVPYTYLIMSCSNPKQPPESSGSRHQKKV